MHHAGTGEELAGPAEREVAGQGTMNSIAVIDSLNTALAGRYRIDRELGAGGMATVYLARDLRHDRDVALKVLKPDLSASVGRDRFLREIQLAARLSHPHILPLFDSGDAAGALYFVMPNVQGQSLRDRLDTAGKLPVDDAVRIAQEVAGAAEHRGAPQAALLARVVHADHGGRENGKLPVTFDDFQKYGMGAWRQVEAY
jgi:hypothetical protein